MNTKYLRLFFCFCIIIFLGIDNVGGLLVLPSNNGTTRVYGTDMTTWEQGNIAMGLRAFLYGLVVLFVMILRRSFHEKVNIYKGSLILQWIRLGALGIILSIVYYILLFFHSSINSYVIAHIPGGYLTSVFLIGTILLFLLRRKKFSISVKQLNVFLRRNFYNIVLAIWILCFIHYFLTRPFSYAKPSFLGFFAFPFLIILFFLRLKELFTYEISHSGLKTKEALMFVIFTIVMLEVIIHYFKYSVVAIR